MTMNDELQSQVDPQLAACRHQLDAALRQVRELEARVDELERSRDSYRSAWFNAIRHLQDMRKRLYPPYLFGGVR
ncbi:MAG: hypothetical protein KDE19_17815 [Caldilineaceae bacterium]|nr:hypothetical protein [Caldilineaceae bacterium]